MPKTTVESLQNSLSIPTQETKLWNKKVAHPGSIETLLGEVLDFEPLVLQENACPFNFDVEE